MYPLHANAEGVKPGDGGGGGYPRKMKIRIPNKLFPAMASGTKIIS